MNKVQLGFQLDPEGPLGIARSSWLEAGKLALMVIDVQNYITQPRFSGHWTADVPGISRKVLAGETLSAEGKLYRLTYEAEASQIDARLAPADNDIEICKTASGAFACADTDSILRNNGISRLVFTGGLTDACVASSVRGAYDRSYLCTVAEDACLTSSAEDHQAALRSLAKFYGWVTSTAEILAALES